MAVETKELEQTALPFPKSPRFAEPIPDKLPDAIRGIKNVCQFLQVAKHAIRTMDKWTTGSMQQATNYSTLKDPDTWQYCITGAMFRVQSIMVENVGVPADTALRFHREGTNFLKQALGHPALENFNDQSRSREHHQRVLALFDKAIALAEKDGVCKI